MAVERDNLDIHGIALILTVLVLVTVIVVISLQIVYFVASEQQFRRKVVDVTAVEVEALNRKQSEELRGYRWIDREQGIVAIPIDRAIALVAQELSSAGIAAGPGHAPHAGRRPWRSG